MSCVKISSRPGFTLIEVMVSLACMAIGFVALWGVHYTSLKSDIRTELGTEAIVAANSELDFLRTLPFTDAMLANGSHSANANDPPLPTPLTRTYTVTTDANLPWKKTVTVTVRWNEGIGSFGGTKTSVQRSVQMSTIIANLN